jgi:hypothetical protein
MIYYNIQDEADNTAMSIVLLLLAVLAIGGIVRAVVRVKRAWAKGMDLLRRPRVRSRHPAE